MLVQYTQLFTEKANCFLMMSLLVVVLVVLLRGQKIVLKIMAELANVMCDSCQVCQLRTLEWFSKTSRIIDNTE
jgi:hypothetical protein